MEKEWHQIVAFNGSQANAFEELVCQLAMSEPNPDFVQFERVGTPDGGVECYWQLAGGEEWGWQAKYYETLGSSQWNNIKASLFDAVETHPQLRRYYIGIPHNLSDARRGKKTQKAIWEDYKAQWQNELSAIGRNVDIILWSSSELFSRLLVSQNAGIRTFFFERLEIEEAKLFLHLDAAIANLGAKYSRDLNFKLDELPKAFDAVCRNQRFRESFSKKFNSLLQLLASLVNSLNHFEQTRSASQHLYNSYNALINLFRKTDFKPFKHIPVDSYISLIREAIRLTSPLSEAYKQIESEYQKEAREKAKSENRLEEYSRNQTSRTRNEIEKVYEFVNVAESFALYLQSALIRAANEGVLFLKGDPGTGKSHLLADIALEQKSQGVPSILLLGEHFTNTPPKIFIQQALTPTKSLEEYFLALESLAKAKNQRIFFIIDAINEGAGKQIWKSHIAGFIKEMQPFKWLAFVFSYRSTFQDVLIPEGFNPPLFIHNGFEGIEYEATKKFFEYYKIQQPAIPILNPEFSNPLFLKTFCITLNKAGMTTIPEGYEGVSRILDEYILAINSNISARLGYNKRSNLVKHAINELVKFQIESGETIIPWEKSHLLVEPLLKKYSSSSGFLDEMIKEGLLIEDFYWDRVTRKYEQHGVVFNYERFNEHLKAIYLLAGFDSASAVKKAFSRKGPLYRMFIDENGYYGINSGLLNAFAIIIPEKYNLEIYEVLKGKEEHLSKRIYDAFLQSLLWRKHDSIKSSCWQYIENLVRHDLNNLVDFYNTILLLAAHPTHYFNAGFVHNFLKDKQVGERDYLWSVQLDKVWKWYERNAISRIVEWAWSKEEKTYIGDEPVYLLGKVLSWFFTTSNRYIRDKATKAFASIFVDRIHLLSNLIAEFKDINDPYVLERVLAGAYGALVHSSDMKTNATFAQAIYDYFFRHRRPPVNINTRDYARCIVEWAIVKGLKIEHESTNLYPPFEYGFPTDIPNKEWLETIEIKKDGTYTDEERGQSLISFSVLSWDFARYILGTNHGSSIPFTDYTIQSKNSYSALKKQLKGAKRKMFDAYVDQVTMYHGTSMLGKKIRRIYTGEKLEQQLRRIKSFIETTSSFLEENLSPKQQELFDQAKSYIESGFETGRFDRKRFPVDIVQRYILKRVFDLGWTMERFGYYDANIDHSYRRADKPERIGKKYQWIGYYEIMALLSDNYVFLPGYDDDEGPFNGTWQHHLRNIDPSCILKWNLSSSDGNPEKTWWLTEGFTNWHEDRSTWLDHFDDRPDFSKIILSKDAGGVEWYMLYDRIVWKSETPLGRERSRTDYKEFWVDIKAVLVNKRNKSFLFSKASTTHFWLRESIREISSYYNIFNGEWYDGTSYKSEELDNFENYPFDSFSVNGRGVKVIFTTEEYAFSNEYDLSGEKIRFYRPSKFLFDLLGGQSGKNDSCVYDDRGNIIAMDPGAYFGHGTQNLLVQKAVLDEALAKNDLELIWFFCGEKEDIGANISYVYRMLYSGFMCFENGQFIIKYHHQRERHHE